MSVAQRIARARRRPRTDRAAPTPGRGWLCACALFCLSSRAQGYRADTPLVLIFAQGRELFPGNANCITRATAREGLDEVGQGEDADAAQSELGRHLLHRGEASLTSFLPIERKRDACGL